MRQHNLFWGSSYDRGLQYLLYIWSDVIKQYPDAQLHIAYGWELFDKLSYNNAERQRWKEAVSRMMNQEGIIHHGRVGKEKLQEIRNQCGIWAYPTDFTEIFCITALECQRDGVVPVTMDYAALSESVQSGVKIQGSIKDPQVQEEYKQALLDLMGNEKMWRKEQKKGRKHALSYDWSRIAREWDTKILQPKPEEPKVSVITITIRTGFWNIMAQNLKKQSYKNVEWIIIDDYEEDRSEIAKKYAEKYNLTIRYIRGDKVLGKYDRRYGLVRANNKAWKHAEGKLFVWLQDFILIPEHGIEDLVRLYRHHPNALLAPTDDYWHCIQPNRENKEDWFDGKTDIITSHSWRNIRNTFSGIRKTENPTDFEMNWSATPKHIIDSLNGFWEFFDDGLGFDNTEIAHRALLAGYDIVIDDTNVATCINLWPYIAGEKENIENRERVLAIPHWIWLQKEIKEGRMPVVRNAEVDHTLQRTFVVPENIPDEKSADWIEEVALEIANEWDEYPA